MSGGNVRISQCMIVKNEEKNIEKALSWGRDIMWEQIVVDTGSTDRTVLLARKMGAKVFEFPWIDDFAAAKNYAIDHCGGDWIALLDADEYMAQEDVRKIPLIISDLHRRGLDGLSTGWQQLDDKGEIFASGTQVRFFRNTSDIRYRRKIHEQLESVSGRELRLGDGVKDLSIFHSGYQTGNMEGKKKSGRNRRLILEELKANPGDYEMMGYMGDECLSDGDREEAGEWYSRSIEHMPEQLRDNDQRSASTFTNLIILLSEKEDCPWDQVRQIYERAVNYLPKDGDFDYAAGYYLAVKGEHGKAVSYLEAALKKLDTYGCSNRALFLAANLLDVYKLLVQCCYEAGWEEKSGSYAVNYLKSNKYDMAVLSVLLKIFLPEGKQNRESEYEAVVVFLSKIYDFSDMKDRLFAIKTAGVSSRKGFADFAMEKLFTPEERNMLGL